jgi:YVTN family beta-propeller protein
MAGHDEMRWRPPGGAAACAVAIVHLLFALALFHAAEAQQFALVANEDSGSVAMIDTATNTVTTTIPIGSGTNPSALPSAIAVTPDGTRAYVTNLNPDNVSVIDTARRTVIAKMPVGVLPSGVAVTPDGRLAYVTNACGAGPACSYPGTVSVVDTATNQVVGNIQVGSFPRGLAITPDGKQVYVANSDSGFPSDVSVITTEDNRVVATIDAIVTSPVGIAITPNGAFAYVTAVFAETGIPQGSILVIDTHIHALVATIPLADRSPEGIAVTPNGAFVYVADSYHGDVLVIDTGSNTITTTISAGPLGSGTTGVAITPDGAFVYVTSRYQDTVTVIDTSTNTITQTIPVAGGPAGIAIASVPTAAPTATPTGTPTARSAGSDTGDGCAVTAQQPAGTLGRAGVLLFPLVVYWVRRRGLECGGHGVGVSNGRSNSARKPAGPE